MTYTKIQLATLLNISTTTIQRLASSGAIPGRISTRPALWSKAKVDAWVSKGGPNLLSAKIAAK